MREAINMKIKTSIILYVICLLCLPSGAATAQPFTLSTDGTEVTDQASGLIWRRCIEGMAWDAGGATCVNAATTCINASALTPARFTHEEALQCAKTITAGSPTVVWRLPSIKELASIVDLSLTSPAIDPVAFPATPLLSFWSASPYAAIGNIAWDVSFENGIFNYNDRSLALCVRLVRAGQ
jgi:hypothetical protein